MELTKKLFLIFLLIWGNTSIVRATNNDLQEPPQITLDSLRVLMKADPELAVKAGTGLLSSPLDKESDIAVVKAILAVANSKINADTTTLSLIRSIDFGELNHYTDKALYGETLVAAGRSSFNVGLTDKAKAYYLEAIDWFSKNETSVELGDIYVDLGSHLSKRGNYDEGLVYFNLAYQWSLTHGDDEMRSDILRYISNVYNRMGNHDEAIAFVKNSLEVLQGLETIDHEKIADCYLSMANIFNVQGEWDSAFHYYRLSNSHYELDHNDLGKTYVHANIAGAFMEIDMKDSAFWHLSRAREIIPKSEAYKRLSNYLDLEMAELSFQLGDRQISKKLIQNALKNSVAMGEQEMIKEANYKLSTIQEADRNYDSALYYYKIYKSYSDSIMNESSERKYASLRTEIETLEKENEIKVLNQELELNRARTAFIVIGSIMLILLLLVGVRNFRNSSKRKSLQLQNAQLKLEASEKDLADFTLYKLKRNTLLSNLQKTIQSVEEKGDAKFPYSKVYKEIERNLSDDKDWEDFHKYFGNVHKDFFNTLQEKYPELSKSDARHAALIKMNLTIKESADILGIDPNSVKVGRFRLRKKIGIGEEDNILDYL